MKLPALILSLLLTAGTIPKVCAQIFDASYTARIAGLNVGQARITGDVTRSSYRIRIRGNYAVPGFFSGAFDGAATGAITNRVRLSPLSYYSTFNYWSLLSGQAGRTIVLLFERENVRVTVDPPLTQIEEEDRVPTRESDRQGVIDPLSALLHTVLRAGAGAGGCPGTERVFSGLSRFDLNGSAGPVTEGQITCRVDFEPIAGHRRTTARRVGHLVLSSKELGSVHFPTIVEVPLPVGNMVIERLN